MLVGDVMMLELLREPDSVCAPLELDGEFTDSLLSSLLLFFG